MTSRHQADHVCRDPDGERAGKQDDDGSATAEARDAVGHTLVETSLLRDVVLRIPRDRLAGPVNRPGSVGDHQLK